MLLKTIKKILDMNNFTYKMVLVVRSDLGLGKGKVASQCCHAAILCYEKSLSSDKTTLKSWVRRGQAKIVLRVDNLEALENLYTKAKEMNIVAEIVRDAGHTQVSPGTKTVLGLGPDLVSKLDTLTKNLKLL